MLAEYIDDRSDECMYFDLRLMLPTKHLRSTIMHRDYAEMFLKRSLYLNQVDIVRPIHFVTGFFKPSYASFFSFFKAGPRLFPFPP
jgi:hypothetical protein